MKLHPCLSTDLLQLISEFADVSVRLKKDGHFFKRLYTAGGNVHHRWVNEYDKSTMDLYESMQSHIQWITYLHGMLLRSNRWHRETFVQHWIANLRERHSVAQDIVRDLVDNGFENKVSVARHYKNTHRLRVDDLTLHRVR